MANNLFLASATIRIILAMGLAARSLATPSVVKEISTTHSSTLRIEQPRSIQQLLARGRVVFNPQGTLAPTASPGDGFPLDRRGEGCSYRSVSLTVLLPFAKSDRIRTASTIAARPTFFVYIPLYQAEIAEFILSDDQDNVLYETTFALPSQSGVVGIQLPPEVPELEVDRFYNWALNIVCEPNDRSLDWRVESFIQRRGLPSSLETALNQTPLRDRPAFFARQGLWHDALATLAQLRLANPQDQGLKDDWSSLLTSVDLQPIAQEPLLRIETLPTRVTNSP